MSAPPSVREATGTAAVLEVFASIQGEGLFVGRPQVFVRVAGCPLRCRYCDTPGSWATPDPASARARVRLGAGGRGAVREERGAPTPERLAAWVSELDPRALRAVSVTGGEPLGAAAFLQEVVPLLRPRPVHLETSGVPAEALAIVEPLFDHVSLDLKLPADLDSPVGNGALPRDPSSWRRARRLALRRVAARGAEGHRTAAAKLVVTAASAVGEARTQWTEALDDVAELAPRVALIVQPVTPRAAVSAPPGALLLEVADAALARGLAPRVLPQVHRTLGLA